MERGKNAFPNNAMIVFPLQAVQPTLGSHTLFPGPVTVCVARGTKKGTERPGGKGIEHKAETPTRTGTKAPGTRKQHRNRTPSPAPKLAQEHTKRGSINHPNAWRTQSHTNAHNSGPASEEPSPHTRAPPSGARGAVKPQTPANAGQRTLTPLETTLTHPNPNRQTRPHLPELNPTSHGTSATKPSATPGDPPNPGD